MAPAVLIGNLVAAVTSAGSVAAGSPTTAAPPVDKIAAPPIDLIAVMPVLIVLGAACVAVLLEAVMPRASRFYAQVFMAVAAIVVAGVWTVVEGINGRYTVTIGGSIAVDEATYVMWGVLLVLALLSVPVMADRVAEPGGAFVAAGRRDGRLDPGPAGDRGRRPRCRPRSSRWRCSPSAGCWSSRRRPTS